MYIYDIYVCDNIRTHTHIHIRCCFYLCFCCIFENVKSLHSLGFSYCFYIYIYMYIYIIKPALSVPPVWKGHLLLKTPPNAIVSKFTGNNITCQATTSCDTYWSLGWDPWLSPIGHSHLVLFYVIVTIVELGVV